MQFRRMSGYRLIKKNTFIIMKILNMAICTGLLACSVAVHAQKSSGQDPQGVLTYSLPSTSLVLEVEAVQEDFYAGPYAKFASKYLGIDVRQKDSRTYSISKVSLTPYIEADHSSRYVLEAGSDRIDAAFLRLTAAGLVSVSDGSFGSGSAWRFPTPVYGDFSDKGLTSNLTSEAATLYQNVKNESAYSRVAVKQEIIVEKSLEKRAAETAAMIFDIREKRYQIVTGDTDATYSGEAMGAAVAEITRLEKEYMTLFTGYSEKSIQRMKSEIVPQKDRTMYVVFRMSATDGLLSADDLSGTPVLLEIVPGKVAPPANPVEKKSEEKKLSKDVIYAMYRVPSVCVLKLTDGADQLMTARLPVYQYGYDTSFPLAVKLK